MRTLRNFCGFVLIGSALACAPSQEAVEPDVAVADVEDQIADYIQKFPYQDTYNYAMRYTGGDLAKFNVWVVGAEPSLVKAGDDKVVRMNNDTFYKLAFLVLTDGPAVLESTSPSDDRFSSFQLMDDRNANYRNIIDPYGKYTLYYGDKPEIIEGEAIEVPSALSVVIVRVEVKDENDAADVAGAEAIFRGITVTGPEVKTLPEVDLLSGLEKSVEVEALRRIDEAFAEIAFTDTIVGPGQEPGRDVPYLNFAAGTKGGWGGPDPAHSAYEVILDDKNGDEMNGSLGSYSVTTEPPPVDAFWSLTVYDTERGGFLHPNKDDRYHINNTGAVPADDGTVTIVFKTSCGEGDVNCLEVPAGQFDVTARYYLPHDEIISGAWTLPKIELAVEE